mgnify:FL=1
MGEPEERREAADLEAKLQAMAEAPVTATPVRCGLPLIILWDLQAIIDEGRMTAAEAAEWLRGGPREGSTG